MEQRSLLQAAAAVGGLHPPFQPGLTGKAHLGAEPEQVPRFEGLDPPEVDGVAYAELVGVAAAPAQPDSADDAVHGAPHQPQPLAGEPAPLTADALDRGEHRVGCDLALDDLHVAQHGAAGPARVGRERVGGGAAPQLGVGPGGRDVEVHHLAQGHLDGLAVAQRFAGDDLADGVVVHHDLVHQAVDERSGEVGRERGHQPDPARRQRR